MSAHTKPCGCGQAKPSRTPAAQPDLFVPAAPPPAAGPDPGPPYRIPVRPLTSFYAADNPAGPAGGGFEGSCSDQEHQVDPKPVLFEVRAFIDGGLGAWLPEPPDWGGAWKFETDRRTFGGVSSRVMASGVIWTHQIGRVPRVSVGYSTSGSRRRRPVKAPPGFFLYESKSAAILGSTRTVSVSDPDAGCFTEISVAASAAYPFFQPSPKIDFRVKFRFEVAGPDLVKVVVSGKHDHFPFYEVLVSDVDAAGDGLPRGTMYRFVPPDDGPGLMNLSGRPLSFGPNSNNPTYPGFLRAATDCCPNRRVEHSSPYVPTTVPAGTLTRKIAR